MTQNKKDKVFDKYDGHCAYCGTLLTTKKDKPGSYTTDHIIPQSMFKEKKGVGKFRDSLENLNPSCKTCNSEKGDLTLEEFREKHFKGKEKKVFYFEKYQKELAQTAGAAPAPKSTTPVPNPIIPPVSTKQSQKLTININLSKDVDIEKIGEMIARIGRELKGEG